ncbi:MAG: cell division protein [Rhodospirillaceae bacterium]|nr:cell division protein [Rhodospirillaceae bacterium]
MFRRRTDLPLDRDALSRFLPWLIAFMVYLAAMAQAGMLGLDSMSERWSRGVASSLTVQVPPSSTASKAQSIRRVQTTLNLLSETKGVIRSSVIPESRVLQLLEPWLGSQVAGDVPLPVLIDVETSSTNKPDIRVLKQKLGAAVPGVVVDDHGVWLARLVQLIRTMEGFAGLILVLILLSAGATIIFTTKTGLAVHHEAIEVLHLTGAHDSYIADQFAWRAMSLGFKGGIIGLGLAVPTLLGLGYVAGRIESGLLPEISLGGIGWISLLVLPFASALLAWWTARMTVMRNLAGMV